MIKIVPFSETYLKYFAYDGIEKELMKGYDMNPLIKQYAQMGEAFVAVFDDKKVVLGIGGIYPIFGDVGQAWLFLNQEAKAHKKIVFQGLLKYMGEIIRKNHYRQIQISCIKGSEEANRLAEHLGFKKEVELIMYTKSGE